MRKPPAYIVAQLTDRWTEIILRALSSRVAKRWRFVSFRGKARGEWRGVVDLLAVRKDTSIPSNSILKRGDLFDIILIQMKGGSARLPSKEERRRLKEVAKHYRAQAVVLFQWERGRTAGFYTLDRALNWQRTTSLQIFG
jgi:hypothetical protein